MEYQVKSRSKRAKKLVEHLMPNLIGQLGLQNSKKFVLIEIGRNITDGNHGCTIPLNGLDSYIISIDMLRLQDIGVTLAHEMVHVKQLAKGLLKAEKGQKYWRGQKFSKRVHYLDTPWEIEAFSKQDLLFRRALED